MEIHYSRTQFAKILGVTPKDLAQAESRADLERARTTPESYGPADLTADRRALGRHPSRHAVRRQLFLNFKGGTG